MDLFIDFSGSVLKDIKGLLFVNWSRENAGGNKDLFWPYYRVSRNSRAHKKGQKLVRKIRQKEITLKM